jgi:death-on-curing protein
MGEGDGQEVDWHEALEHVLRQLHDRLLEVGGGLSGERPAFLAACARPFHTFDGEFLYRTTYERAAALFHGIICDHAFVDGNKRTGTWGAILVLRFEGVLEADHIDDLRLDMLGAVALEAARGRLTVGQVTFWLRRIFEPPDTLGHSQ